MQITRFKTVGELNTAGAGFMVSHLKGSEPMLLCPATGSSATGVYQKFVGRKDEIDAAKLKIIKLDEWAALPMDHHGSCEYYIRNQLLTPLDIPSDRYISFNSTATDIQAECERMTKELKANGPIDLCVLGLGLNGHIAFNDPAEELNTGVHLAKLSVESMAHPMVQDVATKPTHGYTLGMADILQSKAILLVVHGPHKKEIFEKLRQQRISTLLPASFLWLHNNAHCYYCQD